MTASIFSTSRARSGDNPLCRLFELPHQVGGGLGGFFYFGEAALAGRGTRHMIGEKIGICGDDTKQIVQCVRDGLGARAGRFQQLEGGLRRRIRSSKRAWREIRKNRENRGEQGV